MLLGAEAAGPPVFRPATTGLSAPAHDAALQQAHDIVLAGAVHPAHRDAQGAPTQRLVRTASPPDA